MLSLLGKINRSHYPKITQKWSFSAYIGTFVFVLGNKLYGYFFLALGFSLTGLLITISNLTGALFTSLYFITNAVSLFIVLYLILYGRILAWARLGYNNNQESWQAFKKRQKKILFWSWIYFVVFLYPILITYGIFLPEIKIRM